jgi:hypothetical protein
MRPVSTPAFTVAIVLFVMLLILAIPLFVKADELPDMPIPKAVQPLSLAARHQEPRFWLRPSTLALLQTGAVVADALTTRRFVAYGYVEKDPLTRPLIGTRPTYARMIPLGAGEVVGTYLLAKKYPKLRWLQVGLTFSHTACAGRNLTLQKSR